MPLVICGGFTLDDTVLQSGEVMRRAPGGNILYAAVGAKTWCREVSLFGVVGRDYPQQYLDTLAGHGFDVSPVTRLEEKSIHMWALHEAGGRRQLIYQLDSGRNAQMDPRPGLADAALLRRASAVHIAAIPVPSQRALLQRFCGGGRKISLDVVHIPGEIDPAPLRDLSLLEGVTAFLPSVEEINYLFGEGCGVKRAMRLVREAGVPVVAVKLGKDGVLVYDQYRSRYCHIPAYPAAPKDTTGAGDAFCGGFLAGLEKGGDPVEAALMGSVSASFAIAGFGAMQALDIPPGLAQRRQKELAGRVVYEREGGAGDD